MLERKLLCIALLAAAGQMAHAQPDILNKNLIVNGNAESGPAGMDVKTAVSSIPGWTITGGKPTVLPYNLSGFVQLTDPTPPDHGFQYFAAAFPSLPGTMTQPIDVSSAASLINAGSVKFTASAYLGSIGGVSQGTKMDVAFQNGNGQTFSTTTVGPLSFPFAGADSNGMFFQQQIGLVPQGTVTISVTLTLQDGNYDTGIADSLSLVLSQFSTTAMLGVNLVQNAGAEAGTAVPLPAPTTNVPGWSTSTKGGSVAPYGGPEWVSTSSPGPPDRGINVFCGWQDSTDLYQDIDVTGAVSLIDANQVTYQVAGWFGGVSSPYATLTYTFFDWSGKQLAPTAQLSSARGGTALVEVVASGALPNGTRRVRISLNFPSSDSVADNIQFTLSAPPGPPVITPAGIFSATSFGGFSSIAPGTWIEIYGTNLTTQTLAAAGSDFVNGVAPTHLGDITVSVGGSAAFVDYISPGQVNVLVSSAAPISSGTVPITVTNSQGTSDAYDIYINQTQPGLLAPGSFVVNGKQYVVAQHADQTYVLPAGSIPGVASRPAAPGETITIFGIGFGPVSDGTRAGTVVTALDTLSTSVQFLFGNTPASHSYDGLAPGLTGVYQFDIVVPNVNTSSAMPFSFNLGGTPGSQKLYIAVEN